MSVLYFSASHSIIFQNTVKESNFNYLRFIIRLAATHSKHMLKTPSLKVEVW